MDAAISHEVSTTPVSSPAEPEPVEALSFRSEEERLQAFARWHGQIETIASVAEYEIAGMRGMGRLFLELNALPDADLRRFVQEVLKKKADGSLLMKEFNGWLLALCAKKDPASALDLTINHLEELTRKGAAARPEAVARTMFMTLASFAPEATWARWQQEAAKQPPPGWLSARDQVDAIFTFWARKDFAAALQATATLEGSVRNSTLGRLGENLKNKFQDDPSAWPPETLALLRDYFREAGEKPNPGLIQHLVKRRLSQESGAEAAAWVDSLELPEASRSRTDQAVAEAWSRAEASKDAAAAWSWLLSRREASQRGETLALAARTWVEPEVRPGAELPSADALAACSEWLIDQGLGPEAASAVIVLARAWLRAGEPDAALAWARSIADPTIRETAVQHITDGLKQRFPDHWQELLRKAETEAVK